MKNRLSEIEEKVKEAIAHHCSGATEPIKMENNIFRDFGADSLHLESIILELEQHFKILIPSSESEKLCSVDSFVKLVATKLIK